MSDMTSYMENALINATLRNTSYTTPTTVYVALWNGDPGEAGSGGTEVTTTIRVAGRVAVTFDVPVDGVTANTALVDFGDAAGAATISHFAIMDAASAGNMLFKTAITGGSQSVSAGNGVSFAAGEIDVTFD